MQRERTEQFVITDVETLKAFGDPLRQRILMETEDAPKSAKQLAVALDVPVTRLYYHLKILVSRGLLEIADRRIVSGIEEKSYLAVAGSWTIAPEIQADVADTGLLDAMFDIVKAELAVALRAPGPPIGDAQGAVPALALTRFFLRPDEVAEAQRRIESVMVEFGGRRPDDPDVVEYGSVLALYRKGSADAP